MRFFLIIFVLTSILLQAQPNEISISIQPAEAIYGTPFSMMISGLKPGEEVTLKASSIDGSGIIWISTATYEADQKGVIDLSRQAPLSGDYDEPDVLGLLWSMKPSNSKNKDRIFRKHAHGLTVQYQLTNSKGETATAHLKRCYQKPDEGLVQVLLDANGCKGFLYYPETGGPFPGIILLSGSGGGNEYNFGEGVCFERIRDPGPGLFQIPRTPGLFRRDTPRIFLGCHRMDAKPKGRSKNQTRSCGPFKGR